MIISDTPITSASPTTTTDAQTPVTTPSFECGAIVSQDNGEIHTRNYPEDYLANDLCHWQITVNSGQKAALEFNDIHVGKT